MRDIRANGIDLTRGRDALDFGRGYYTTTNRNRAVEWAKKKHAIIPAMNPRLIRRPSLIGFRVPLAEMARLDSLAFVRGDIRNDAFWSFVHHCRRGTSASPQTHLHPTRASPGDYYDLVTGPIAVAWPPKGQVVLAETDQVSFHTAAGIAILDNVIKAGRPGFTVILL